MFHFKKHDIMGRLVNHFAFYLLMAAFMFIGACTQDDPDDNTPVLRPLSVFEQDIIHSSNTFSQELFERVSREHREENVFISPFSVTAALAMTMNGADRETKEAIKNTLKLSDHTDEEINQAYKDLVGFLLSLDKTVIMNIANSNWSREGLTIKEQFLLTLMEYYDAEVHTVDFADPGTVNVINGWIEDKTQGKIKDMLDAIPDSAVMYLINAIYFKAIWTYQFDENQTEDQPFHLLDGVEVMTPTMYSEGVTMGYFQNDNYVLLDIPYGNGQFSFTIVTTASGGGQAEFDNLTQNLSIDLLTSMLEDTIQRTTGFYLPKFKIEFKETLNEPLKEMGMTLAFDPGAADFSNLFEETLPLFISRVIHQSTFEINESGAEAAAATVVEVVFTSAGPSALRVDRPFIFMIREKHTNLILFVGKFVGNKT
jgi:serine protease inhibitor